MLNFLVIGLSLVAGVLSCVLIAGLGGNGGGASRKRPLDLETVAASGLGLTLSGTVLALSAAIAPHTLGEQTGTFEFWWFVGFAPAAFQFLSGTYDLVRVVHPLESSWRSWSAVGLSWLSGGLFAYATWLSLYG